MGTAKITQQPIESTAELGLDQSVETLLNECGCSGQVSYNLRVSADGISILLDSPDPLQNLEATVNRIEEDFRKLELPQFPNTEVLTEILKNSCQPGESLVAFTIMKGWSATPSRDGRLEWQRDFFNEDSSTVDEDEVADFWDQNDQQSVDEDELLARVFHAVEGEPGLDVFSREIAVPKPTSVKLRSGKGVRQVDEGQCLAYYAEVSGRVRYQDDTLVVDDVYCIKGDVSLETGNIKHTGTVHVEGDVKTGATIEADGDILVKGMLDPCNIKCGGSLTVIGGIVGQEDCLIEVGGDLKAMHIGGAIIRCVGDVHVLNEIANAEIKACGKILVPTGRIAGGEVTGRDGILVAEAGGSSATKTLLVVGFDYLLERRMAERESRILKLEEAQDKIQEMLNNVGPSEDDSSGNSQLCQLSAKRKMIGEAIIKEHSANRSDRIQGKKFNNEEVLIQKEVWVGTAIRIGEHQTIVRASIEKPRVARLTKGKIRILPLGEGNKPKN